jgi:hypothetical protein
LARSFDQHQSQRPESDAIHDSSIHDNTHGRDYFLQVLWQGFVHTGEREKTKSDTSSFGELHCRGLGGREHVTLRKSVYDETDCPRRFKVFTLGHATVRTMRKITSLGFDGVSMCLGTNIAAEHGVLQGDLSTRK